jgi:hypothetical protein
MTSAVLEERSGCLFARAGAERWLLLWPDGYAARLARGKIEVLNEEGVIVGIEGQRLSLGGGETNPVEVGGATSALAWATDLTGGEIPERCGDLFWLVAWLT